jgi:hypothetical protein
MPIIDLSKIYITFCIKNQFSRNPDPFSIKEKNNFLKLTYSKAQILIKFNGKYQIFCVLDRF